MEAINDASKNVARALELLRLVHGGNMKDFHCVKDSIQLLEEALDKLTNKM